MSLRFAYNTNGVQNHRLEDAIELIAAAGYDGVALTLDVHHLDPFASDLAGRTARLRRRLDDHGLGSVIETGARYLLDPWHKHEPTLVSAVGQGLRVDFLRRAIEVAAQLGSEAVSFWSGALRSGGRDAAWQRLVDGVREVLAHAAGCDVVAALEPEPGMVVETVSDWQRLADAVGEPVALALDVGHLVVTGEGQPAAVIEARSPHLGTVTVEDMRRGDHVHRPFGDGDVDLPSVLAALERARWRGLVCVELSRDSHRAHEMVPAALQALRRAMP